MIDDNPVAPISARALLVDSLNEGNRADQL